MIPYGYHRSLPIDIGNVNKPRREEMRSNPSEWKVAHQYAGGETYIRVYRLRDKDEVDHSGNREYYDGIFDTDSQAEKFAKTLNSVMH